MVILKNMVTEKLNVVVRGKLKDLYFFTLYFNTLLESFYKGEAVMSYLYNFLKKREMKH